MRDTYTVDDVAVMTGLNPRTIRDYLRRGLLNGEKTSAGWRFTERQFVELITRPEVERSIRAKDQGMVLDFLARKRKSTPTVCAILDIPLETGKEEALREKLLELYGKGDFCFRYRMEGTVARITVVGPPAQVAPLLEEMTPPPCETAMI